MTSELPNTPPVPISEDRIWVDGCWDFSHHGHAGVMLQAKQLGKFLAVGIHSDEAILENKGPTVMNLAERVATVDACKWSNLSVPHAPYVTETAWIDHFGCKYVVHGDDVTTDASGGDTYRDVKVAGRFKIVKRTPGISTTDLVGRMLLCTKQHHIKDLAALLKEDKELMDRMEAYATDETGLQPGSSVWDWRNGISRQIVKGSEPKKGRRVVYVDGGFDLFSSGHIEFLRRVLAVEEQGHPENPLPFVIAGVHDDLTINQHKGLNYPIMSMYERSLLVLQCRYINAVVLTAPFTPTEEFLKGLPYGLPDVVYHGPTAFMPESFDPYVDAKKLGIFRQIEAHPFMTVNAGEIVDRIVKSRSLYEERQRMKGVKTNYEKVMTHE